MAETLQAHRLTDALAAYIEGGISIVVSSGDAGRGPTVGRAVGCRVSADRRSVTVFLSAGANAALLEAVAATGRFAAAFSEPTTHRSIQLKGSDAAVTPAGEGLQTLLDHHAAGFVRELTRIGYTEAFTRTLLAADPDEVAAVTFTPTGIFDQTPGPRAGDPLDP
ncbi:hypothetical protein [Azospirillum sp. SYSU D00513]|uniref:hypothetical protein n=1 Tax=Azospirillum sp. SYSU D00513 TaxID=2812561 RepID=UPI001A9626DE|nr:hypothetical protein [Azospirillum sp. SYSU D00513]